MCPPTGKPVAAAKDPAKSPVSRDAATPPQPRWRHGPDSTLFISNVPSSRLCAVANYLQESPHPIYRRLKKRRPKVRGLAVAQCSTRRR